MIATPFYRGQGLGNQLACYVTTRALSYKFGYNFGVFFPERFKGYFFKNIWLPRLEGLEVLFEGEPPTKLPPGMSYYHESSSSYDPFVLSIPDNYVLHGNLQGEGYFEFCKGLIYEWLDTDELNMPDDLCVINFRGGDYVGVKEFFLPQQYWHNAMKNASKINSNLNFEVHTDDPKTAKLFFPEFPIIRDIERNWNSIRYAKNLIISNSSFAWFPAWLNTNASFIIAPLFWQRYNLEYWLLEQNKTKKFLYQDKAGRLLKLK